MEDRIQGCYSCYYKGIFFHFYLPANNFLFFFFLAGSLEKESKKHIHLDYPNWSDTPSYPIQGHLFGSVGEIWELLSKELLCIMKYFLKMLVKTLLCSVVLILTYLQHTCHGNSQIKREPLLSQTHPMAGSSDEKKHHHPNLRPLPLVHYHWQMTWFINPFKNRERQMEIAFKNQSIMAFSQLILLIVLWCLEG